MDLVGFSALCVTFVLRAIDTDPATGHSREPSNLKRRGISTDALRVLFNKYLFTLRFPSAPQHATVETFRYGLSFFVSRAQPSVSTVCGSPLAGTSR